MIQVFKPKLSITDKYSVLKALLKNNISGTSPVVNEFEIELAKKFDRKYAVAVSNGSVALDLALQNIDFKEGDEVIVPSHTIISCLSAILRSNAIPVFCDVDKDSWNMTLENVKKVLTKKTKAVLMVHTYGLQSEATEIANYCKKQNLYLIEDAAEAHGQKDYGRLCGSFGDISTFSFYANKHITTGEGGAVLTDSDEYYQNAKQMRNLDFRSNDRFKHNNLYWNYRMGGLQASLGLSQLKSIDKTIEAKIRQGKYYQGLLKDFHELLQTPLESLNGSLNHFWVYGVVINKPNVRDKIIKKLKEQGIETRPFFWPLHLQPALPKNLQKNYLNLNVSENLGKNGLYLPLGKHVTKKNQNFIVKNLINSTLEA